MLSSYSPKCSPDCQTAAARTPAPCPGARPNDSERKGRQPSGWPFNWRMVFGSIIFCPVQYREKVNRQAGQSDGFVQTEAGANRADLTPELFVRIWRAIFTSSSLRVQCRWPRSCHRSSDGSQLRVCPPRKNANKKIRAKYRQFETNKITSCGGGAQFPRKSQSISVARFWRQKDFFAVRKHRFVDFSFVHQLPCQHRPGCLGGNRREAMGGRQNVAVKNHQLSPIFKLDIFSCAHILLMSDPPQSYCLLSPPSSEENPMRTVKGK